jgi:hypothetical protein
LGSFSALGYPGGKRGVGVRRWRREQGGRGGARWWSSPTFSKTIGPAGVWRCSRGHRGGEVRTPPVGSGTPICGKRESWGETRGVRRLSPPLMGCGCFPSGRSAGAKELSFLAREGADTEERRARHFCGSAAGQRPPASGGSRRWVSEKCPGGPVRTVMDSSSVDAFPGGGHGRSFPADSSSFRVLLPTEEAACKRTFGRSRSVFVGTGACLRSVLLPLHSRATGPPSPVSVHLGGSGFARVPVPSPGLSGLPGDPSLSGTFDRRSLSRHLEDCRHCRGILPAVEPRWPRPHSPDATAAPFLRSPRCGRLGQRWISATPVRPSIFIGSSLISTAAGGST